jgi:hypothetical protein
MRPVTTVQILPPTKLVPIGSLMEVAATRKIL